MNINEIAKIAGVSRATVSRYLNNGYVCEETGNSFEICMGGQMIFRFENGIAQLGFSEVSGGGRSKRRQRSEN